MAMRSWLLKSWPEAAWHMPAAAENWPLFHHMGTQVNSDRDEHGRSMGETVWVARADDGLLLGAAWEWVEVQPGLPALRDPNGFVSNLRLVDAEGQWLGELHEIIGLNRIAHRTPWQVAVCGAVRDAEAGRQPVDGGLALEWPRALGAFDRVAPFPRRGTGRGAGAGPTLPPALAA